MSTYVALLRGINVGGNSRVAMSELKHVFDALGFSDIATYINSGNVIFSSESKGIAQIQDHIEKAIEKQFGFHVHTLVITAAALTKITKAIPTDWQNNTDQKTDVIFLWEKYDSKESIQLIKTTPDIDQLIYVPGAIVWHIDRTGYKQSSMNKFIGSEVYKHMTARNVNTVRKLAELVGKR